MAATYDLEIDAGATYSVQFAYKDANGSAINLTGYTGKCQIRTAVGGTLVLEEIPTINASTGVITLTFTAAETALLTSPRYLYALEIYAAGGEPTIRLAEGAVRVSLEVVK